MNGTYLPPFRQGDAPTIDAAGVVGLHGALSNSPHLYDEQDSGGRGENPGEDVDMPDLPYDIVTIHCPKDCLIMYPVQPRKLSNYCLVL